MREWHETYKDSGLVIIGNHYPEFGFESDLSNLSNAVADLNIPYPVAQDNLGETWKAYETRYWPTLFLIDKQGHIRYKHIGEVGYDSIEGAIQYLLAESIENE